MNLEEMRFPIGRFSPPSNISAEILSDWIDTIRSFPEKIDETTKNMSSDQLDTPYRHGGWTVRQLVHHVADSHVNSYIRFKWTMTEELPLIKTYNQKDWAELADGKQGDIQASIDILRGIHVRWCRLLDSFDRSDFDRQLRHPDYEDPLSLGTMLALYAWHCDHHLAHITSLQKRKNWN